MLEEEQTPMVIKVVVIYLEEPEEVWELAVRLMGVECLKLILHPLVEDCLLGQMLHQECRAT